MSEAQPFEKTQPKCPLVDYLNSESYALVSSAFVASIRE